MSDNSNPISTPSLFDEVQGGNAKILEALDRNHKLNRRLYAALIAILETQITTQKAATIPNKLTLEAIRIIEGIEEFHLPKTD